MTALNDRLYPGVDGDSVSTDPEVSFDIDHGSEPSIEFEETDGEVDMAQERRLQLLELAVIGMSDKFDAVMNTLSTTIPAPSAAARGQDGGRHTQPIQDGSQPSQPTPARQPAPYLAQAVLPHHTLAQSQPPFDAFLAEQLQKEDFAVPRVEDGKTLAADMYVKTLHPKPYMYIKKPGVNTLKKKLDARESISFNEYVVAFIKMVRDPRAGQLKNVDNLLEHLQQVAEDTLVRDWPSARRWSQETFDAIERGDHSWDDKHQIQFDRLSHAISAAKGQQNYPQPTERLERKDMPCRDYNSATGCAYQRSHPGRNVTFAHVCSLCFAQTGERAVHPANACTRTGSQPMPVTMPRPRVQQFPGSMQPPKNANGAYLMRMSRQAGSNTQF